MSWKEAALILYTFAAPSAVMAVPYAIGMAGFLGGLLICLVITSASVGGGIMLLHVRLLHPTCHTFGDLGKVVLGRPGQVWGNAIQIGNFCLFLPCALQFCALALRGIVKGIPGFGKCNDYYVFTIALICLLTTQVRKLTNTTVLTYLSLICVLSMGLCMIVAAFTYDNPAKVSAQIFGNPESDRITSFIRAAGGFTINAWGYVPAFLTVELVTCMDDPPSFSKSLWLSGAMNVAVTTVVGFTVVARWGYNVGEVITITDGVTAWHPGSTINTLFNTFQLLSNFVSYMLDSVPLGRFCQKAWAPAFRDSWSASDVMRYLGYTLPTFVFALSLSIFVPSVNTLLDFTTAFTTPMVTQIYPAVLYWKVFCRQEAPLLDGEQQQGTYCDQSSRTNVRAAQKCAVVAVFLVGYMSFLVCFFKAVGYITMPALRPPMQIGCDSWQIYP